LSRDLPELDALFRDIKFRIGRAKDEEALRNLVDKHLFFQAELQTVASGIGFRSVEYVSWAPRQYYREEFIDELLQERGVSDPVLASKAKELYGVIFDLFDSENYVHSLSAFVQVILRA
jgi:hypothetical protein